MADIYTKDKRSAIMSRIRGRDTAPELAVRKLLHRMGYRFRLHDPRLPGKPDIVLPRHKRVIFVHGCFWHGHAGCNRSRLPASNIEFWQKKITANIERDLRNTGDLRSLGWEVLVVWSCETRDKERLTTKLKGFLEHGR